MNGFKRRGFLSVTGILGLSGVARAANSAPARSGHDMTPRPLRSTSTQLAPNSPEPFDQFAYVTSLKDAPLHAAKGGWARQLNHGNFASLNDLSIVNMRLEAGGMREMFWRRQAEWGYVVSGVCRIMSLDEQGRSSVDDVSAGDIWSIPAGTPHSIIGLAPAGAEVLMFLDDAAASEFDACSVSQWVAATPPDILAKNFATPPHVFTSAKKAPEWIGLCSNAGDLDVARKSARIRPGAEKTVYLFSRSKFYARAAGGYMQVVDPFCFPASRPFSASSEVIHVGGMREMHWHPHAAEIGIVLAGAVELCVMGTDGAQKSVHVRSGDVWTIPQGQGHCVINRGSQDAHILMIYKADHYADYSLSDWLTHAPHSVSAATLGLQESVINRFPNARRGFVPR